VSTRSATLCLVITALAGCAGNGKGLDANGEPNTAGGGSDGSVTPDLQSIEDNVFTPICSKCHIGASAPEGLELDAEHAYQDLVGVPSAEDPSLLRVKPGDPDDSYIVHKIEGLPGIVGSQMPLGETPLPSSTIAAIRQWISDGAVKAPAAAVREAAFRVKGSMPYDGSTVAAPVTQILVSFTSAPDATLLDAGTVALERLPAIPAAPGSPPVRAMKFASLVPETDSDVLVLRPQDPLDVGRYRLTLGSPEGLALADLGAHALEGKTQIEFTVDKSR